MTTRRVGEVNAKPHFSIAGIPVRIEPVFWLITAFMGFNLGEPALIITWVGVVLVSILVHEFGHALALKAFGQSSSVVLHGFGGMTISQRRLSRGQSIAVSLAGPVTAFVVLGLPLLWLRDSDFGFEQALAWRGQFGIYPILYFGVFVNIWWSLANLLPIRPLDGGNVMTELIGIQPARIVSVVVGAAAAVWAYTHSVDFLYAAFFAAMLAFINFSEYRRTKQGTRAPSAFDIDAPAPRGGGGVLPGHNAGGTGLAAPARREGGRPHTPPVRASTPTAPPVGLGANAVEPAVASAHAWNLLRQANASGAAQMLARASGPVDPFAAGTVALALGQGPEPLARAYLAQPGGPSNLVPATIAADRGEALGLAQSLLGAAATGQEAVAGLQTHLHYAERFAVAGAVGEALYASGPPSPAQVAFDTAAAWSRAGDAARALTWVARAVGDGFTATGLLDGESDLAAVRGLPGWSAIRAQLP